jgi:uncharacterized DUF497 family protein
MVIIMIRFEWDPCKNQLNINKHGVSFKEASTVFEDDDAILFDDPDHSEEEERFLILGLSKKLNLLIVSHCYRRDDSTIRIISARKASRSEENTYIEFRKG